MRCIWEFRSSEWFSAAKPLFRIVQYGLKELQLDINLLAVEEVCNDPEH
jgi:hypothetical protein